MSGLTNFSSFISGWYAVLESSQLRKNKILAIERFGLKLALWRNDQGQVQIFKDRCPHRGAQLSLGCIKNNRIQCPFHGYEFSEKGECEFSPEFNIAESPKNLLLKAEIFKSYEILDMIWIYIGPNNKNIEKFDCPEFDYPEFDYPELAEIHKNFRAYSQTEKIWDSHITYCIENQLDYTHLQFVHKNTIGRGYKIPKEPKIIKDSRSISIYFDQEIKPRIQFFFPNTWVLNISEKMNLVLYFSPINSNQTQLYLRTYREFLIYPEIKKLVDVVMNFMNQVILKQDQKVVASQGRGLSYQAQKDNLMFHDQAIAAFRNHWKNNLISLQDSGLIQ